MKSASIDIGSNTILLFVGELNGDWLDELEDESRVTGLGKDLDETKAFHPQSMKESEMALRDYHKIIAWHGIHPKDVIVTATEASRVATNAPEFFAKIKKKFGFEARTITPADEGYFTLLGVYHGLGIHGNKKNKKLTIMDIGGASTEIVRSHKSGLSPFSCTSLPCGSVRSKLWSQQGKFEEIMEDIIKSAGGLKKSFSTKNLIGVAGTMTCLVAMVRKMEVFDAQEINGQIITPCELEDLLKKIEPLKTTTLKRRYPFLGKRADTIVTGAKIAVKIGDVLGAKSFQVSTFGLRHGTFLQENLQKSAQAS